MSKAWLQLLAATPGIMFAAPHILFEEANKLVRQHRPGVLLIEPFLESRDHPLDQGSRDGISAYSDPCRITAIRTDLCERALLCRSVGLLDDE